MMIRAKILEKLLRDIQKKFGFDTIIKIKIFDKKDYQFLKGRNSTQHIVLDHHVIEIIDYSPDPREYECNVQGFDYLDDFLLSYFMHHINRVGTILTVKQIGHMEATCESTANFLNHKALVNDRLEHRLLSYLGTLSFFALNCFIQLKIKRKEYLFYFTYITTFFAWLLLIVFWILFFLNQTIVPLLFIAGLIFISNGYLQIELLVHEYKSKHEISWTKDRILGGIGIIALFLYFLYFYKLIKI